MLNAGNQHICITRPRRFGKTIMANMIAAFLSNLLKDRPYVQMTYMTGILPIAKYSDGLELNMFDEYDMACKEKYSEYFGFLDEEVDRLYDIYKKITKNSKISRSELKEWYGNYCLYNPRAIVSALRDNQLTNYWNYRKNKEA